MGRGLSPLQRWILIHASEPKPLDLICVEGYWRGDSAYYARSEQGPPQRNGVDIVTRDIRRGYYRKFSRTMSTRVSVSRSLARLIKRGLLKWGGNEIVFSPEQMAMARAMLGLSKEDASKTRQYGGYSLTLAGLAMAKALAEAQSVKAMEESRVSLTGGQAL